MNSLEVNCFPDAGLRRSALHPVSSASQTGTLMWPCYSKFFWTRGYLASSASPGQLCPLVIPHSLTVQLPLNVDFLPDLGPNSAFDELPKDTTSALFFLCQFWWLNKSDLPTQFKMSALLSCLAGMSLCHFRFCLCQLGKRNFVGPILPRTLQSDSESRVTFTAMTTTNTAAPQRPAPAPICFSEITEAFSLLLLHGVWSFFFSPLWKTPRFS